MQPASPILSMGKQMTRSYIKLQLVDTRAFVSGGEIPLNNMSAGDLAPTFTSYCGLL